MISILVPIRLTNETNAHEHWRARQKRVKAQREAVAWALAQHARPSFPCVVRLTRIAPSKLDSDGHVASCKGPRDAVAEWLGINDNDPRCEWDYGDQERGSPKFYGVRIEIVSLTPEQQEWRAEAKRLMARCFEGVA